MEKDNETAESQNLEARTTSVVQWLRLTDVPTAAQLDPDDKIGLRGAFKKEGGIYADVISPELIEDKKRAVMEGRNLKETAIPLLEEQHIGSQVIQAGSTKITSERIVVLKLLRGKHIPLFKEQVYAVAQYLVKLGLKIQEAKVIRGESFTIADEKQPRTKITSRGLIHHSYKTKDPNISVIVERDGQKEDSPVIKVKLSFHK